MLQSHEGQTESGQGLMDELKRKAEIILRDHLLRCFNDVVMECPDLIDMPKKEAVDYLLTLRREGKIRISLNTTDNLLKTQIDWIS
jgi:hypothetical protein